MFTAFAVTPERGDEVVVPPPCWVSYTDMAIACDGAPVIVPCPEEAGFKITAAQLDAAIMPRTRRLLINSPSNRTGVTCTDAEHEALGAVLKSPSAGINV